MHELSIAEALAELAEESAREAGANQVICVNVRIGKLAGVVKSALEFSYDAVTEKTLLEGSDLRIEELEVIAYCPECKTEVEIEDIRAIFCPVCQSPCPEIRQGKEMEIESIEIETDS